MPFRFNVSKLFRYGPSIAVTSTNRAEGNSMGRTLAILYAIVSYVIFLTTFLYAIAFVGGFVVPKTIDSGHSGGIGEALLIDFVLLGLFAIQHSAMARPAFKKVWTRVIPPAVERSTYVLLSSLVLDLLFWQWQPMPREIWDVRNAVGIFLLRALFIAGWLIVLLSTYLINHADLFGLRQVFLGDRYSHLSFRTPVLYRVVRHPIMLGFIIAFWATPKMTVGHLVFAVVTTGYILVAIQFEERDLLTYYGEAYADYRHRVSMLLPLPKRGWD